MQSLANSAAVFANTYTHIYTPDRLSGTIGREYILQYIFSLMGADASWFIFVRADIRSPLYKGRMRPLGSSPRRGLKVASDGVGIGLIDRHVDEESLRLSIIRSYHLGCNKRVI